MRTLLQWFMSKEWPATRRLAAMLRTKTTAAPADTVATSSEASTTIADERLRHHDSLSTHISGSPGRWPI